MMPLRQLVRRALHSRSRSGYDRRAFLLSAAALGCVAFDPAPVLGRCKGKLNRGVLDTSLSLGTGFLLKNQKKAGNFQYELNWKTLKYTAGDSPVRQAGAAWGLALILHDAHSRGETNAEVEKGLERALAFFDRHSKVKDGRRFIVYPDTEVGRLGTVALTALTLIDYLRVKSSKKWRARLDEYLAFLLYARKKNGRFHAGYLNASGKPVGAPSPYFDGEALLALIKAARYLGRTDLLTMVRQEAEAGYQTNVVQALDDDPDSNTTKGYYQWASMAYFELAKMGSLTQAERTRYGKRLVSLAEWMIDVHRTLKRTRNTGYAYEGIIPAYVIAKERGDARADKLRCTIDTGMSKLCSWQLGNPIANGYIKKGGTPDARALGGVQNHRKEPLLRIDVTQHQMHAVILARRFVWTA